MKSRVCGSNGKRSRRRARRRDLKPKAPSQPTVLVFRDKHTQEVQNYAIVGGTLWIFSEQRATKLPLSWLDIEATTQANDDRGVNFQVPQKPGVVSARAPRPRLSSVDKLAVSRCISH